MSPRSPTRLADDPLTAKQVQQAEELLFSETPREGFARALFRGEFRPELVFPYPTLAPNEQAKVDQTVADVDRFLQVSVDPAEIDRQADLPRSVIEGLGKRGVLGMTAPVEYGGLGFSQQASCQIMERIGARCASTAVFVNAHHSIGIRALLLFGTPEQKERWLGPLARGEKLAGFALTEEQAGSDAANVQTTAVPTGDGSTFVLNGTKRYITNGAIADVLTVMARTPDPHGGDSKITAFLVTPDLPGFEVVEGRMPKCGIRGTATAKLAFHDMPVPAENILGPRGKGLKVALTVLDFGRTTFGASCTGVAKFCLAAATRHAATRKQFGRPLADLELIQKKLAYLAATAYAMEATTYETAALIDRGVEDYMLETAILKVFSTEALWQGVYETLQTFGGQGYFTDEPYERLMRDARINTIGEGANEVLLAFIALVGMRDIGQSLQATLAGLKQPSKLLPTLWSFASERLSRAIRRPTIPVSQSVLRPAADRLARRVALFGRTIEKVLIVHRESILTKQLLLERIAWAVIMLTTAACTLARLDSSLASGTTLPGDREAAELYLAMAFRKFDDSIRGLSSHDDPLVRSAAAAALRRFANEAS
jgi:acyl-CoA dehydrogenase family protein 9